MKLYSKIANKLRCSRIPMIWTILLAIVILGTNSLAYLILEEQDALELSQNQENESESSSEVEIEDMDEFLDPLIQHQFIWVIKPMNFQFQVICGIACYYAIDTPPPQLS